jgi:transcriptional regulator with XRE-family HTH domain/mannose-6-phosphate isomerase-like protein (cupin superfamily)
MRLIEAREIGSLLVPVYSNLYMDYGSLAVGQRVRELRKAKGWTLADLASKLSISIASLSAIETEKAVLDLERLVQVCEALDVRPDVLFPRSRSQHYEISRRPGLEGQPAALKVVDPTTGQITAYHNLLRPLADAFVGKHIEPFHIEVQPVSDGDLQFICHHHEEFFFVLRGEVECLLRTPDGLVSEILSPGDCMYFWSYLPHCIRSTSSQAASCIHTLYSAQGATDSEHGNVGPGEIIYFRDVSHKSLTEQVAAKIAALRQARGMSIADFAREVDVGVRQLTEIERGRQSISLRLLLDVCRRFRKPLEYFLASTLVDRPFYYVCRAREIAGLPPRTRRQPRDGPVTDTGEYRPLAAGFHARGIHPYYAKLPASSGSSVTLQEHHGQEFVYVLNGQVALVTMQEGERMSATLSAGDSCFIDSTVPHGFAGVGLNPYEKSSAEIIDIFWCPLGESYLFADGMGKTDPSALTAQSAALPG